MPATKISLYQQVADTLREQILAGDWSPGDLFPTEAALGKRFNVSRITIRQALAILDEEGLIVRLRGSGTYVSEQPTRRIPLQIDYGGSMRTHAPRVTRRLLDRQWTTATTTHAPLLGVPPGDRLLRVERVDRVGADAVAYDQGFIPATYAQHLSRRDLVCVDFLRIWSRRMGERICECRQTVDAVACPSAVGAMLALRRGAPVLRSTEIYRVAAGPAGLFISYYHPDHISINAAYQWDRP